jgi:flagellar hook-associated protein 1
MRSTFHGLETARRGMTTQQAALYTTGHNIANANTPGYTRQRVNFQQTEPYPAPAMNRPQIPGQMGTGVEAGSIQRVREGFLDLQYRGENNKFGYWSARSDAITKMEDIMNEPSDNGLAKTMDQFWQSLQDLSVNPENEGSRAVVRQRGIAVADTFHYLHSSLSQIQKDIGSQIGVSVTEINSIAEQISQINKQISEIEPHGYLPNDLYDERDRLLDQLSQFVEVKIEAKPVGGNALKIAEGTYNVSIVDSKGHEYSLVTGDSYQKVSVEPGTDVDGDGVKETPTGPITKLTIGTTNMSVADSTGEGLILTSGKLKGLVESYGYSGGATDANGNLIAKGIYPDMLTNLDNMAYSFATLFNAVHKEGYALGSTKTDIAFFDELSTVQGAASKIAVSKNIDDLANIAASTKEKESGNGMNAINLANVSNMLLSSGTVDLQGDGGSINIGTLGLPLKTGTLKANYEGWIGKLGVDGQQAARLKNNTEVLQRSVEERRQSVSSVSLDEEMTNMIRFQHAYNAAARQITVVDEMLDKIINGMGLVGR